MIAGRKLGWVMGFVAFVTLLSSSSLVAGEAAGGIGKILNSFVSGVVQDFNKLPSPHFDAPVPDHQQQPHGAGVPANKDNDNGFESLRDFSNSADQAFIRRRLFNTSVALTVPLFSFTLPTRASEGSTVDLANQAIFGLFSLLVIVMVFAVPVLFTGTRPTDITGRSNVGMGGGKQGILNQLLSSNKALNFMGADFSNQIGIDGESCLKKTICQAHRTPSKYGLLSMPFRIFFPPPTNGTADARASSFQLAARDGKYTRKDCGKNYKCFFDVLDLADYFMDWWKYSSDPNYVEQY